MARKIASPHFAGTFTVIFTTVILWVYSIRLSLLTDSFTLVGDCTRNLILAKLAGGHKHPSKWIPAIAWHPNSGGGMLRVPIPAAPGGSGHERTMLCIAVLSRESQIMGGCRFSSTTAGVLFVLSIGDQEAFAIRHGPELETNIETNVCSQPVGKEKRGFLLASLHV